MRLSIVALSVALLFGSISCSEDEVDPNETFQVNYKDQDLQGKITGEDWLLIGGIASSTASGNSSTHTIRLFDTLSAFDTVNCARLSSDSSAYVVFTFQNEGHIIDTSVHKLRFDNANPSTNKTVKFNFYDEDGSFSFVSVSKGEYQITGVDTVNNFVLGKMHIQENSGNTLNGNFRVSYCNY